MSYRFGPTRLVNFGPFEDVSFDFSKLGLTCVEGEFVGHGCDSNGSGKSYLYDGVSWIVFGRTIRDKVEKDGVVRLLFDERGKVVLGKKGRPEFPPEGCWGEQHVVGGPKDILIRRYRAHPIKGNRVELYVNGEDVTQGRDSMTQLAIDRELGLDYDTFLRSVAFGAGDATKSFFSATDSARKGIMERILGLEVYGAAEKVARARARALATELQDADSKRERVSARIEEQEETLAQLLSDDELRERKREVTIARGQLRSIENGRPLLESRLAEAESDLEDEIEAARGLREAYETEHRAYLNRKSELERAIRKLEREEADYAAEIRQLEGQLRRWTELSGRACPTCTQVVPVQTGKKLIQRIRKEKEKAEAEVEARADERVPLQVQLDELRLPEDPPTVPMIEALKIARASARQALRDLDARIREERLRVRHLEGDYEAASARSKGVEAKIAKLRGELTKLDEDTQMQREELVRVEFWIHGFGNAGIKSFLIEAEVPAINKAATAYAHRLLGSGSFVKLSATRDLKSGAQREEMSVEGTIPGCCMNYANASKGQKRRLDLCLLLAFREVVARRASKSVDQFFADELFDGLDQTGEEHVIELLRGIADTCPVALVTHSQGLKSAGDRVLTVRHEDGISTVHETADAGLVGSA